MRRGLGAVGVAVLLLGSVGGGTVDAQLSFGSGVNQSCISMRITYSLCGIIPYPCAYISFWQPKWIVSTRATQESTGRPHYHFHHATVRPVDQLFTFTDPCSGCAVPMPAGMVPAFYESTADPLWRAGQAPVMSSTVQALWIGPIPPLPGAWGPTYPRVGYVSHPSPVVASGLAAVRAFNIARQPIDLWPVSGAVRPSIPLVPMAQGVGPYPCMCRRFTPVPPGCFRAGFDMGTLMPSPASPTGIYEWVIWKRRTCVLPVPVNWCAEALNNLPKLNACF